MISRIPFDQLRRIIQIRDKVADALLGRKNVIACGVGLKTRSGEVTDQPSIIVSVRRKERPDSVGDDDLIPPRIDDVDTDVIEVGEIEPLGFNRLAVTRPVRPGSSIGHRDGTAGTAGCIVRRGGEWFILSNNHVLALLNEASPGDPILQPGPTDGGSLENIIGELAEFVPLRFLPSSETTTTPLDAQSEAPSGCAAILAQFRPRRETPPDSLIPIIQPLTNEVDVALVRPLSSVGLDPRIIDVGNAPAGVGVPELGSRVIKSGRTTGLTAGMITQIDVTVDVNYEGTPARFTNQVMLSPMSRRGDSGSLVMDQFRKGVGLLFSGSAYVSVMHPLDTVLRTLNVDLVTQDDLRGRQL
ncbi:MAG: hypothetical protein GYB64_06085 [Chloroflexi bacterium]|nr:hypothetical protein [Chloroflexota bacterium]